MLCTCNNLLLLLGLLNKSPEGNQLVKGKGEFLTPMGDGGISGPLKIQHSNRMSCVVQIPCN